MDPSELIDAVTSNKLDLVSAIIDRGVDVNIKCADGKTALHFSASNNFEDVTSLLLSRGADPTILCNQGVSPIHLAVKRDRTKVLKKLVEFARDVNIRSSLSATPLHTAAHFNRVESARILLAAGADIEALDRKRKTPLHCAASSGYVEICEFLLHCKSDTRFRDRDGKTPLDRAIEKRHQEVVDLILDYDPDVNSFSNSTSPLHVAAEYGDYSMVRLMIHKGVNIMFKDVRNRHAVDVARNRTDPDGIKIITLLESSRLLLDLVSSSIRDKLAIASLLIRRGASTSASDSKGRTPLSMSIEENEIKTAKLLLNHGANYESSSITCKTTLHLTCEKGNFELAQMILKRNNKNPIVKRRLDFLDDQRSGQTALHVASAKGFKRIVRLLLKYGATYNALDVDRKTPEDVAADNVKIVFQQVKQLFNQIESGLTKLAIADLNKMPEIVNVRDRSEGLTPLMWSLEHNQLDVVQAIMKNKSLILDLVTSTGETCLHRASSRGNHVAVEYLLRSRKIRKIINDQSNDALNAPLHLASTKEIAFALLSNGAIYNLSNLRGSSPCDVAKDKGIIDALMCIDDLYNLRQTKIDYDVDIPREVLLGVRNTEGKKIPRNLRK